ncbi:MAG: DUF1570 domain-containing protein [Thermoguttaceae bacterium]|nr:DUF1570 domain-containing protein [Thermoguttaceae bacterium]
MPSKSGLRLDNLTALACWASLACGGCAISGASKAALPVQHTVVREQLVVHSDFPIPANHRLLEELTARRRDLQQLLGLPMSDEPIHVYLFDSPVRFDEFVRLDHPGFPRRRAFFLETDTRLQVYAQWGDRVAEDLRHEVTHGYLHSVVPNLPLWLDEGLAEYCEVPRGHRGLVWAHLELLLDRINHSGWRPDLPRLERIDPARDMTQEDYAEAWAWVHFLLESGPEPRAIVREYLGELRRDGTAKPVSARLRERWDRPDEALMAHLGTLAAETRAVGK